MILVLHLQLLYFIKSVWHSLFNMSSFSALLRKKTLLSVKLASASEVLVLRAVHLRVNEMWCVWECKQKIGLRHMAA